MEEPHAPRFSVVIPTFNREQSVTLAVRSALAQSHAPLEVIVVDDGSTDNTKSALVALADSRVRYIRQDNAGPNTARNRGISEAVGTHIAFLDSDDQFTPEHLERAAAVIGTEPSLAVYAPVIVLRENGASFIKPSRSILPGEHISDYLSRFRGWVPTSTLVVHKQLAARVLWDEQLRYGQDVDFAIRLAAAGARFVMLPLPSALCADSADFGRVSSLARGEDRLRWIEKNREFLTAKAYHAFRGWAAKPFFRSGQYTRALGLYLAAVCHRAWPFRTTVMVGLQVFLPATIYRGLANAVGTGTRK